MLKKPYQRFFKLRIVGGFLMSKIKNGSYFGEWKIDGYEDTLSGILKVNHEANQYCLNLYSDDAISIPSYYVDVIHGKTHEGRAFTFYKCSIGGRTSTSIYHEYKKKYIYEVNFEYILDGVTFSNSEDVLVEEVDFSFTNLGQWAFQEAVKRELTENRNFVIETINLDDIIHQNDDFKLSIIYNTSPDYGYLFTRIEKITTDVRFNIKFNKPTSILHAHKLINQVRDFLTLCTTLPSYVEYITAIPANVKINGIKIPINVYGGFIGIDNKNDKDIELKRHDNYISVNKIKKDFDLCMRNWFVKNDILKPVIELYSSINYHRTSYERHFLNLVQALEAYHRLTRKNQVLPKEEHTNKIKGILENVPEEHREWLKLKLAFSNEPSLHERLEDLLTPETRFKSKEQVIRYRDLFIIGDQEKIDLIRDIKNTRNYNTHFDNSLLKKTAKGEKLVQLTLLLKVLVEYYLLTELEIDEEIVLDFTFEKMRRISWRSAIIESFQSGDIDI